MTTAGEASRARTPLGADLKAGVDALSYNQRIEFTRFVRLVLPLDGYVFWVRGDLVSPPQPKVEKVMGSLHYSTDRKQDADENYSVNKVMFTSEAPINFLNEIAPNELYIGAFNGLEFAFSTKRSFYKQASLWHYVGDAVYADMKSQIITSADQLYSLSLIVSNSLPLWLQLNLFNPSWPFYPPPPPAFTLYPSFLSPANIEPPWATVHIGEDDTRSLVSTAGFGLDQTQSQIAADKVRVTMWGASNDHAMDFLAMVNRYSYDVGLFGIMNNPAVRDAKREQREMGILAQKKVIDFEVSYVQGRVSSVARQLIVGVIPTFLPAGYPNNNTHATNIIGPFISTAFATATH